MDGYYEHPRRRRSRSATDGCTPETSRAWTRRLLLHRRPQEGADHRLGYNVYPRESRRRSTRIPRCSGAIGVPTRSVRGREAFVVLRPGFPTWRSCGHTVLRRWRASKSRLNQFRSDLRRARSARCCDARSPTRNARHASVKEQQGGRLKIDELRRVCVIGGRLMAPDRAERGASRFAVRLWTQREQLRAAERWTDE